MPAGYSHNPSGRNQHKDCVPASDETFQKALREFSRLGITDLKVMQENLLTVYGITMSTQTIQRRKTEMGVQLVLDELARDPSGQKGPRTIKQDIAFGTGIHLTREFIDSIMHEYCPEGFVKRHPLHAKIERSPSSSLGPNDEWSADGYDKLMNIGIAVYGFRDKASGKWLSLRVVPNNRSNRVIAYLYLSLLEERGGMPLQTTTDCGSETTEISAFGNLLREYFAPDIDSQDIPAHRFLQSVHNTAIGRGWRRLRSVWGDNVCIEFTKGIIDGTYNEGDPVQYALARWLWSTTLTREIEDVRLQLNHAPIRKDAKKLLPSGRGVTPEYIYSFPEEYGLKDQLISVNRDLVSELKVQLGGDSLLNFVKPEFADLARGIYESMGSPSFSSHNAWFVFKAMLPGVTNACAGLDAAVAADILSSIDTEAAHP